MVGEKQNIGGEAGSICTGQEEGRILSGRNKVRTGGRQDILQGEGWIWDSIGRQNMGWGNLRIFNKRISIYIWQEDGGMDTVLDFAPVVGDLRFVL